MVARASLILFIVYSYSSNHAKLQTSLTEFIFAYKTVAGSEALYVIHNIHKLKPVEI